MRNRPFGRLQMLKGDCMLVSRRSEDGSRAEDGPSADDTLHNDTNAHTEGGLSVDVLPLHPMPRRRFLRLAGCLAGLTAFGGAPLALAGCRDSDVLTQKIIGEPLQYEVDYSLSPVALENPMSRSTMSNTEDESDRQDDAQEETPKYDDETQTTTEETNTTRQNSLSNDTTPAQSGSGDPRDNTTSQGGKKANKNNSNGTLLDNSDTTQKKGSSIKFDLTGSDAATKNDENAPRDDSADDGDSNTPAEDWKPSENGDGTSNGTNPIIISSGDIDSGNIPNTVARIAAAGINATLVQAIGGPGALACANAGWLGHLTDAQFAQVFPGELDGVQAIEGWGDDGSNWDDSVISQILNAFGDFTQGTVAVVSGYGAMSQTVAATFQEKGVHVVELKPMGILGALDTDIQANVKAVGELLRGMSNVYDDGGNLIGGGDFAKSHAKAWADLHTEAVETTLQKNGGYTCLIKGGSSYNRIYQGRDFLKETANVSSNRNVALYHDSWAAAQKSYVHVDGSSASVSFASRFDGSSSSAWPSGSWWSDTWTAEFTVDISDGVGISLLNGGGPNSRYLLLSYYLQLAGGADKAVGLHYYLRSADTNGEYFRYQFKDGFLNMYCHWNDDLYFRLGGAGSSEHVTLGDFNYPFLFVRDSSMASHIANSAKKADRSQNLVGFYNMGADYGVVVIPCGVAGSWADGSFESFLLAPYFWCLYNERQGNSFSLSYSDDFVDRFYSVMYRCGPKDFLDASGNSGDGTTGCYGKAGIQAISCNLG